MVKRNIVLLDIDYITHDEKPVMRLFGKVKGEKSNDLIALDDSFVPYLYVLPVDDIEKCTDEGIQLLLRHRQYQYHLFHKAKR